MKKEINDMISNIVEMFQRMAEDVKKTFELFKRCFSRLGRYIINAVLFIAASNKEWHVYKTTKKWRTRKKYRKMLLSRL